MCLKYTLKIPSKYITIKTLLQAHTRVIVWTPPFFGWTAHLFFFD